MSDAPAAPPALPRLLTARQIADTTGIPLARLYELTRDDRIPHVRLGRAVRYSAPAVALWIATGGTGYTPPPAA